MFGQGKKTKKLEEELAFQKQWQDIYNIYFWDLVKVLKEKDLIPKEMYVMMGTAPYSYTNISRTTVGANDAPKT